MIIKNLYSSNLYNNNNNRFNNNNTINKHSTTSSINRNMKHKMTIIMTARTHRIGTPKIKAIMISNITMTIQVTNQTKTTHSPIIMINITTNTITITTQVRITTTAEINSSNNQ